jgi:branched-subunit amino acid ABC-type transport system permease component
VSVPLDETAQLVVNGLVAGTVLAVPAIGFTAIYAVLRFPNFSLASHITIGAFAGYVANAAGGWPAWAAVAAAFVVAGAAGVINDHVVLRPLRPAGALTPPSAPSR